MSAAPWAPRPDLHEPPEVEASLVCAGCGAIAPAGHPFTPRCPARRAGDDIDHVLARALDLAPLEPPDDADPNPFVRYRALFHAYHVARSAGWPDGRYVDLVRELDDAVAGVEGHGFRVTPLTLSRGLADAAGLGPAGSVWVKDETGNVSGSHKARHLFGILLELRVAEAVAGADPSIPLAIASCGNAALAAAVVARAAGRELRVFVPDTADAAVVNRLRELGSSVVTCERRPGEAGDPSYLRLQEAIAAGAVPFTCQGPDNGLAIEGGATLAWEIADGVRAAGGSLDRIVVQVGGGALASGIALGFADAAALGAIDALPRLDTVQTRGGWPLARAYRQLRQDLGLAPGVTMDPERLDEVIAAAAHHRSRYMWPWETEPRSVAHGILDDETYDWLAVVRAMLATGGRAVVVDEAPLVAANALAREVTGIDADETGTAGLAGLLALSLDGVLRADESVAVVLSGVRRHAPPASRTEPASSTSAMSSQRSTP
jgi:threonine synthase